MLDDVARQRLGQGTPGGLGRLGIIHNRGRVVAPGGIGADLGQKLPVAR